MIRPSHEGVEVWPCVEPVDFSKANHGAGHPGAGDPGDGPVLLAPVRVHQPPPLCDDGRCGIDTHPIENAIRALCVGRRNGLFCDTVAGAHASARLDSLIESAPRPTGSSPTPPCATCSPSCPRRNRSKRSKPCCRLGSSPPSWPALPYRHPSSHLVNNAFHRALTSRQNAKVPMGGLVGSFGLEGPALARFWPCLWLGEWTHTGKGCSMGLGRYVLEPMEAPDRTRPAHAPSAIGGWPGPRRL